MYRISHVLRGADQHREDDQEDAREAMVETVHKVIVVPNVHSRDLPNGTQDSTKTEAER